jgi:hypothetical protein
MSEIFKEYTHIVVDPTKTWPYFDIPGCLKRLSWSVNECYGHIWPQWFENSSLTRHAVVQLALYTCYPFGDVPRSYGGRTEPEGYIVESIVYVIISSAKISATSPLTRNRANSAMVRSTMSLDLETIMDFRLKRPNQWRWRQ